MSADLQQHFVQGRDALIQAAMSGTSRDIPLDELKKLQIHWLRRVHWINFKDLVF